VTTSIRLIESRDAEALVGHLARDAEAFARWDPEHPPGYYTAAGQRARIGRLLARHADGELWPAVVLAGDAVIGQVTAQNLLLRAWRKAELGYWIAYPHQGQGHATRAVGLMVRLMTRWPARASSPPDNGATKSSGNASSISNYEKVFASPWLHPAPLHHLSHPPLACGKGWSSWGKTVVPSPAIATRSVTGCPRRSAD
jgi:hypothetical protein